MKAKEDEDDMTKVPLARIRDSSAIDFLPNNMFTQEWEYNNLNARKRIFLMNDGNPEAESPTPPIKASWINKWEKDDTIQVTCSGKNHSKKMTYFRNTSV